MRVEQIIPEEIQQLVNLIEKQKLILAELTLDEITDMPNYDQILRVADNNIALSQGYFKAVPKRILVHKVDKTELDLNLDVPNWERFISDQMALVDEEGNRMLFETNYYDEVLNEETQEMEEVLVETKYEPKKVTTLKGLIFMAKSEPLISLFEKFTQQWVNDVKEEFGSDYFTKLKK